MLPILLLCGLTLALQPFVAESQRLRDDRLTNKLQPGNVYKKVCEQLEHLKRDQRLYMWLYKRLAELVNEEYMGTNECRQDLMDMFELIKRLVELVRSMEKKKEIIREGTAVSIRFRFSRCLEHWLNEVEEIETRLFEIEDNIRTKNVPKNLTDTFANLNENCIEVAKAGMLPLAQGEAQAAVMLTPDEFQMKWIPPVPDICKKVKPLFVMCRDLITWYIKLWRKLLSSGISLWDYPHQEMGLMLRCILDYCRAVSDLHDICTNRTMSAEQLEKALCEWLMKIKDIRFKLVEYYERLNKVVIALAKEHGGAQLVKSFRLLMRGFLRIIIKLDICIFKIDCYYLEIAEAGGPRFPQIS